MKSKDKINEHPCMCDPDGNPCDKCKIVGDDPYVDIPEGWEGEDGSDKT